MASLTNMVKVGLDAKRCGAILCLLVSLFAPSTSSKEKPATHYVNPFIGTDATGHTYPGPSLPFGMVQLSPDTRTSGWQNCSGYHASNPTIIGFSHTHLSGTGIPDLGDILFMPTTGQLQTVAGDEVDPSTGYRSAYRHETEQASAGYYSVILDDHQIKVELTVTERAGVHRYTFPASDRAHVIVDLLHGLDDKVLDSAIEIVGNTEIVGFRRSRGWAKDQRVYFAAEFSKPFQSFGTVLNEIQTEGQKTASGKNVKAFVNFTTRQNERVLVKVGISAVSIEGARKNLKSEIPDWDFERVRKKAEEKWSQALGKIKVEGGTEEEKVNFYTALYHALLTPNLFTDVDGQYRGADGQVHQAQAHPIYTVFSLWDTFRAAHPLLTIIDPQRALELVKTLITKYEEGGVLPVWELWGNETFTMIGYHSVPVIVDAYVKGLRGFDVEKAYEAMKKSAERDDPGLRDYRTRGYVAADTDNESVSKTLEYAYDDWCIAQMAKALGRTSDYETYIRRAQAYRNIIDPSTGFARGKRWGQWVSPFDPYEVNSLYTEANAWQYSFFVPQDVESLIALMGGDEKFIEKLDTLFSAKPELKGREQPDISGMIGQYAHGNEPSHHMAYLYNYAGAPWKTQERVRQIVDELYKNRRDGLCGNEDCGQMSAWYIFSALGFYPVTPGQDMYALGSPLFERATITVAPGKTFTIRAKGVSRTNKYIQSARLNGKPYTKSYLKHADIMGGGELVFQMGNTPNRAWATKKEDRPASFIEERLVSNPVFVAAERVFHDITTFALKCDVEGAAIYYTDDGTTPSTSSKLYTGPIRLDRTATIKAIASKSGWRDSFVESLEFIRAPDRRTIAYKNPYSNLYTAGGMNGLLDYVRGNAHSFASWQGFHGVDLEAVVDLGAPKKISRIAAGFLQKVESWIFLPSSVEYFLSEDGREFKSVGRIVNSIPLDQNGAFIKEFETTLNQIQARYVKIVAKNIGVCPPWHPGAGKPSWVFADEIVIE